MGNIIARAVLLGWPLVTLVLFLTLSTQRAIVASLVGAFLMGPFGLVYNFPEVPPLDKHQHTEHRNLPARHGVGAGRTVSVDLAAFPSICFCSPMFSVHSRTGFANTDTVQIGSVMMPGLSLY